MSDDRLREAAQAMVDGGVFDYTFTPEQAGLIAAFREALDADERGGGEGLDVDRLERAYEAVDVDFMAGDESIRQFVVRLAAEYARLAAAQPAYRAIDADERGGGEGLDRLDALIAQFEAADLPEDGPEAMTLRSLQEERARLAAAQPASHAAEGEP